MKTKRQYFIDEKKVSKQKFKREWDKERFTLIEDCKQLKKYPIPDYGLWKTKSHEYLVHNIAMEK